MAHAAVRETSVSAGVIRLVRGDITELEVDGFVFYASPNLALGSGFGTAISVRGGPAVQRELARLGPLAVGDAVVTGGGNLRARWIIHAVGPRFQEAGTEPKLAATVRSALRRADEQGMTRVALPAMGAGFYGIPNEVCARVMLETIRAHLADASGLREVVICVLDSPQFAAFRSRLGTGSSSGENVR